MKKRSEPEIRAYIDGYNASFKQFKSCLDMGLIKNRKAADKMQIFVDVVNGIIEAEGDEESKSEKEIIKEIFKSICPYTGKECETFNCNSCEIEQAEREFVRDFTEYTEEKCDSCIYYPTETEDD
jgi:hypothetical protein